MNQEQAKKRLVAIESEGSSWLATWKEIQPYIAPHRGYFNSTPNAGSKLDHKTLLDGTAVRALGILSAGMTGGLTSPSRPWFKLGFTDTDLMKYTPVKYWLEDVESNLLSIYARAKVYGNFSAIYEEVGAFSTAAMMVLSDFQSVVRGRHFTAGEFYLDQDGDNRVDTFGRKLKMNVGQMVKTFGEENVSSNVRNAYIKGDHNVYHGVAHLICPNTKHQPGVKEAQGMKFSSVYWEEGSNEGKFLRVGGFNTFPVMAPRWGLTRPADVYGRSGPGWQALGDVKMLQKLQRDSLTAVGKVINPPMLKDSSVPGSVNTIPGGVSVSDSLAPNAGLRPAYQIQPDLAAMENKILRTQEAIRAAFFSDLFLMLAQQDRPQMTAREVVERHEEKLLVLGPLLESLEGELLDPFIDRTFELALEAGVIPPPPPELEGLDLKVEYISPLAQAQKMIGVTAIEQGARFVGSISAVKPEVIDIVDWDEMTRQHLQMDGVSPRIIRDPEVVAAERKARAEAAAAAQAAEQGVAMAQGAKTLSETKVGQNSALDAVLGGIAGIPSGQAGEPQ